MNHPTEPPPSLPPQPPLQTHRSSASCNRHPEELFTGFCPSCLCERLSGLDPNSSSSASASASRKPSTSSTAAAALKSIFRPPPSSSFFPELRRTKSFSASKNDASFSATAFEPQRKSCDVRARSSISNIFNEKKTTLNYNEDNTKNPASKEEKEEEKENREENFVEDEDSEEIRVLEEPNLGIVNLEIEEEKLKTMKAHIDLNSSQQPKKASKDFKGGFWSAASVFSNKLQKWRQKQKTKKHRNEAGNDNVSTILPVEKPITRHFMETQSEIAEYGLGRRSCDTDPRFSLDIGRMSFDNDPWYSFDEPRASWDGYLIGRTAFPRMPTMLSVVEDAPVHVLRTDTQIPVEEPINHDDDSNVPGGSVQTREYYDSSSRRRKSLDRSNSIKKTVAGVVAEMDELKCCSIFNANANVNASKVGGFVDGDLRDLSSNLMRDDCCSETIELGFKDGASVIGNSYRKGSKKSCRWSKAWSIWGFIHRRGGNKDEDEDRYRRANNGARHSFSESWRDMRGDRNGNGDGRGTINGGLFRSNSSVSWRNAQSVGGSFGTLRRNASQSNGHGKKAKDEFVLERNKSARYSPKNIENGLLRLYLTPTRGSRRNGSVKSSNQAHSIPRNDPRLY